MKPTIVKLAVLVGLLSGIIIYVSGIVVYVLPEVDFGIIQQTLIWMSIFLMLFSLLAMFGFSELVVKVENLGIDINNDLKKDYFDGCFTAFILGVVGIFCVDMYSLTTSPLWMYIVFPLLTMMSVVITLLMMELWQISRYVVEGEGVTTQK